VKGLLATPGARADEAPASAAASRRASSRPAGASAPAEAFGEVLATLSEAPAPAAGSRAGHPAAAAHRDPSNAVSAGPARAGAAPASAPSVPPNGAFAGQSAKSRLSAPRRQGPVARGPSPLLAVPGDAELGSAGPAAVGAPGATRPVPGEPACGARPALGSAPAHGQALGKASAETSSSPAPARTAPAAQGAGAPSVSKTPVARASEPELPGLPPEVLPAAASALLGAGLSPGAPDGAPASGDAEASNRTARAAAAATPGRLSPFAPAETLLASAGPAADGVRAGSDPRFGEGSGQPQAARAFPETASGETAAERPPSSSRRAGPSTGRPTAGDRVPGLPSSNPVGVPLAPNRDAQRSSPEPAEAAAPASPPARAEGASRRKDTASEASPAKAAAAPAPSSPPPFAAGTPAARAGASPAPAAPALPRLALAATAGDGPPASVDGALLGNAAHLRISTGQAGVGDIELHLRVRGGVAHLRVDGEGGHLVGKSTTELSSALAGAGLSLGKLETPSAAPAGAQADANRDPAGHGGARDSQGEGFRQPGGEPQERAAATAPAPRATGRTANRRGGIHVEA